MWHIWREEKSVRGFFVRKPEGKGPFGKVGIVGRVILK
jgi:hypothetical protein